MNKYLLQTDSYYHITINTITKLQYHFCLFLHDLWVYKNAIENAPDSLLEYLAMMRGFVELLMTSSCL